MPTVKLPAVRVGQGFLYVRCKCGWVLEELLHPAKGDEFILTCPLCERKLRVTMPKVAVVRGKNK